MVTGSPTRLRGRSGPCSSTRARTWPRSPPCTGGSASRAGRERRAQAAYPARKKPELTAIWLEPGGPWDMTKLAVLQRGAYYHLYVTIDIFSRRAAHFEVHAMELGELAKDFMSEAAALTAASCRWPSTRTGGPRSRRRRCWRCCPTWRSSTRIPGRRSAMTTRTARRSSRRRNTAWRFPARSVCSRRRAFRGVFFTYQSRAPASRDSAAHPVLGAYRDCAAIQDNARPCRTPPAP